MDRIGGLAPALLGGNAIGAGDRAELEATYLTALLRQLGSMQDAVACYRAWLVYTGNRATAPITFLTEAMRWESAHALACERAFSDAPVDVGSAFFVVHLGTPGRTQGP